ncbi:MAG: hypothetical protein O7A08_00430 [SAR324 cluster bacterium]|nr:hypothetical protein [SAR324 cluster bacterium]MCZ6531408.1 hypothetical protein [SAR324 cluster bacterium]MCZ6644711.1 hypothetical protein [SAR324 cluster bacterium]MCZ6844177.1 hypothetical protein [SAR324 cluster bacterium]
MAVSKDTQRKLTAILSADVVGYSRLMGDDEEATFPPPHCPYGALFGKVEDTPN